MGGDSPLCLVRLPAAADRASPRHHGGYRRATLAHPRHHRLAIAFVVLGALIRLGGLLYPCPIPTTKPGALAPGICLLSRGAIPGGAQLRDGCALQTAVGGNSRDRQIREYLVVGRSGRRWYLGPGVKWDVPLGPGHLRRCSGWRVSPPGKETPGTSHLVVRNVGAGAGSSARSSLLLRGGVFHSWSLRIPLRSQCSQRPGQARTAADLTSLNTFGIGTS